jgi:hypothetical protein
VSNHDLADVKDASDTVPILNLVKKIIELPREIGVDLWIVVIERRADDEVRCHLNLLCRGWSDFVGRPGTRIGR